MRIPKTIHYVWVGENEKPKDILRCMKSWKKHLGEYEIVEWNENNFDISSNKFVKQAYEQKKWAYVSDYIRAYAIYKYGGIYLDTDVIVLDDLTRFLDNEAFVGFENSNYPFTAVFGAEKGHPLIKDMIDYYHDINFEFDKNNQLEKTNTKTVSELLVSKYHCIVNNKEQMLETGIRVYPDNVLCNPSLESSAIHILTGTWMEGRKGKIQNATKWMKLHITTKRGAGLFGLISKYYKKLFLK
jgi:mannosyltransferase OCH1-like enzyme